MWEPITPIITAVVISRFGINVIPAILLSCVAIVLLRIDIVIIIVIGCILTKK